MTENIYCHLKIESLAIIHNKILINAFFLNNWNFNGIKLRRFPFYYSLCFLRMELDDGNDFDFRKR